MAMRRRKVTAQRMEPVAQKPPARLLNVALSDDGLRLSIIERDDDGVVRVRAERCPNIFFVRCVDIGEDVAKAIARDKRCSSVAKVGDYWRVDWVDRWTRKSMVEAFAAKGVPTFEGDVGSVRRWMVDHRTTVALATPRTCYLDIETDSRVAFSRKEQARILCWAVVGHDGRKRVGVLDEDTDESEMLLLHRLRAVLNDYDQVCAWNGDGFDFVVIKARIERQRIDFHWNRWLWLDQMVLFQRMNTGAAESGDEKQSFALNAVAMALLGTGKDTFDSSKTWDAWRAGGEQRQRLVRYCVKDTELLRGIEEKTGFIALLQTLAEACNVCPDTRGMNPTNQVEGFLLGLGADADYRFPTSKTSKQPEPFKGAYVMEPTFKGIVKGVHVCDFASLYPSVIITWNMSPETLLTTAEADARLKAVPEGTPPDQVHRVAGIAFSPLTGKFFDVRVEGLLPKALKKLLALRKYWNDLKSSLPPGTPEWVDANRKATAYKIAANSFYGVIGSFMSRFFVKDVAESVAQCGRWLLELTLDEARKRGMDAGYGDTDSAFVAGVSRPVFEEFVKWCNEVMYPQALTDIGCRENAIKLAYEKEFERIVFTSAKRYAGRYTHYKGKEATADSKPEVKGLEYKRGDSIRLARRLQMEVVDFLVGSVNGGHEDPAFFAEVLDRWQHRILFEDIELDDIIIAKSLNKSLDDYVVRKKNNGEDYKQLPHIEIAKRMRDAGEDVSEGTKIRYFLFDAGGAETVFRLERDWDGRCDRYELWDKLCAPPTLRLLEAAFPQHSFVQWKRTRPKAVRSGAKKGARMRQDAPA